MTTIAFIGLGNMGAPMMRNLIRAGHTLIAFDLSSTAVEAARADGAQIAASVGEAAAAAPVIITMLPAGQHVRAVYLGADGIIARARPGSLLIDSSTIDVATARALAADAAAAGHRMLDAPVSGGVGGAAAATLTFMVGGSSQAFATAEPILQTLGKAVIHAGGSGTGQAAKICNNLMLGIEMVAVCEAFALAERLGLEGQKLFDIASKSSGQCWSLTSYCPVPGPVPTSPANRDYQPGFTAAMMLKDLKLAVDAAQNSGAALPLGAGATMLYTLMCNGGMAQKDFSGMMALIRGQQE